MMGRRAEWKWYENSDLFDGFEYKKNKKLKKIATLIVFFTLWEGVFISVMHCELKIPFQHLHELARASGSSVSVFYPSFIFPFLQQQREKIGI